MGQDCVDLRLKMRHSAIDLRSQNIILPVNCHRYGVVSGTPDVSASAETGVMVTGRRSRLM